MAAILRCTTSGVARMRRPKLINLMDILIIFVVVIFDCFKHGGQILKSKLHLLVFCSSVIYGFSFSLKSFFILCSSSPFEYSNLIINLLSGLQGICRGNENEGSRRGTFIRTLRCAQLGYEVIIGRQRTARWIHRFSV